jgi:hypothetical protein
MTGETGSSVPSYRVDRGALKRCNLAQARSLKTQTTTVDLLCLGRCAGEVQHGIHDALVVLVKALGTGKAWNQKLSSTVRQKKPSRVEPCTVEMREVNLREY